MDPVRIAELAKALGHPARVRIVELLARQTDCRGSDVFAELPLAQSTVSEHLRILREAGIVAASPVGTGMVYCLDESLIAQLREALADIAPGCCSAQPTACVSGGCK